jgi:hypothetical protein
VKTFIVFFDFDKSDLTDKAQEVVGEAVRTAKTNGFVKVLVTGHTDTVGSDRYNQALSIRRAQSVKDEMVHEGLDANGIAIEELPRSTGPNRSRRSRTAEPPRGDRSRGLTRNLKCKRAGQKPALFFRP